ncbi:YybH family protein [Prauserella flavalba]|uniref:DUF4440 domain-containing protein n=1 Tax=Prauserella flavalba TaxID=1477506 RepID=A0A318LAK5_9PSEU|nr:nuclear transport factor 2 family protein [Prauserella flavalba]PXY18558.1 DUF4440 domain-containing protein [Prauserella flavalba]
MNSTVLSRAEAEVRDVIAEQTEALRAGDADALVARYTAETVKFDLAPPLRHTGAEVLDADGVRAWLATFDGPVDAEVRDLDVTVGGDVAFCHSLNRMSAVPRGSAEGFDLWYRATVCLRRIEGTWRITHEHTSTPFYMDGSFRSAIDLTP